MSDVRQLIKKYVPGASFVWRKAYAFYKRRRSRKTKLVFTKKYLENGWGSEESVSGYGSELKQARIILERLPAIFEEYEIHKILDLPCGDFNWMKYLNYGFLEYIGADIVSELIVQNQRNYSSYGKFVELNILKDNLPKVDLIFCRDCLVHFSYEDIKKALKNIKLSGATYLMTTTFTRQINKDILTGDWRPLNLEAAPFLFPAPLRIMNEGSNEPGNKGDKCLALWRIGDL